VPLVVDKHPVGVEGPGGPGRVRVAEHQQARGQGDQADRDVDVEAGLPVDVLDQQPGDAEAMLAPFDLYANQLGPGLFGHWNAGDR
jgi:hypothetical protein